jgi:ComEC/Rec2-related protein
MRTILAALGCLFGLIVGASLGRIAGGEAAAVGLASAAIAVAVVAWVRLPAAENGPDSRWPTAMMVALVMAAGVLRGASVGPQERERSVVRAERAGSRAGPELRELEVIGASEPGPSCTLRVRDPDRPEAAEFILEVAASACPRSQGDRIAVSTRELEAGSSRVPSWRETWSLGGERGPWSRPTPTRGRWARANATYWSWVARARQHAWEVTRGDPAGSLSAAISLGLRSTLGPEDREALRQSGLGHLIAVSGLQVALAGLWLQVLARRLAVLFGGSARLTCVIAWLPLLGYIGLTGAAAPAVRSAAMLIAIDLGTLTGRTTHGPTLLAVVAAAMGLVEPAWVFDPGFQLSVAAMAAIVTAPAGQGILASSWRITWATAPLTLIHFDVAPLHALLGNFVALPLFSLLMPASLIGWVLHGWLGDWILAPARLFATPILDAAELLARVPGADARLLAGLAVVLLILDHARRVRARRRGDEFTVSSWLPPRLACLWLLVVALPLALGWLRDSATAAERFDWLAVGTPSSRSLVIHDRRSGWLQPRACLIRPVLGASDTELLLERIGVAELEVIVESASEGRAFESGDPRADQLRRELERVGVRVRDGSLEHCPVPDKAELRAALRACQARHGGRGRVTVIARAGRVRCWSDDRWIALPELGPEADTLAP